MIAKLQFRRDYKIDGKELYSSTQGALRALRGDLYTGWLRIYATPVKGSTEVTEKPSLREGSIKYYSANISGMLITFLICLDSVKEYKLPSTFYVKVSKNK